VLAYLPLLACAKCGRTLPSLPPPSVGFASQGQGPASAADAFLWCRCSNAALRSSSWFLGEVAFKPLPFLRAPSARPLCVVVARALVLMRVASIPPPRARCPLPAARSHSREREQAPSPLHPQMQMQRGRAVLDGGQWVHSTHLCAVLPHRVCSLGLASAVRSLVAAFSLLLHVPCAIV
jgi:hypothetical protein